MFTKIISSFVVGVTAVIGGIFGSPTEAPVAPAADTEIMTMSANAAPVATPATMNAKKSAPPVQSRKAAAMEAVKVEVKDVDSTIALSDLDLLALADDKYSLGNLPLGDDKYVTEGPKKGHVYLCNAHKGNPGSKVTGSWMHGDVWNIHEKMFVQGSVSWPNAQFSNTVSGENRTLSGNGLPISHNTGVFPVVAGDPAYMIDANPNAILSQTQSNVLPVNPEYSTTPYCMGGEVGIMLSGVPLFNAFDAGLRDAAAHEIQDSCEGHPERNGQYHYHNTSSCLNDASVKTVIGYALDGFPITGSMVADKKYLTTEDLDVCHGITSDVLIDGKLKTTYHYVMTMDFPYSASCFRGKPVITAASVDGQSGMLEEGNAIPPVPPPEAVAICSSKSIGSACSFNAPDKIVSGICQTILGGTTACVPTR